MGKRDHGTMSVTKREGEDVWRVRIDVDDGTVVESKATFPTMEEAKAAGNAWCKERGVLTEISN